MNTTTYNGWRNHSTWVIGLHLMDTVVGWICEDREEWGKADDLSCAVELFQELLAEQLEACGLMTYPLLNDLLDTSDIDWWSLARHALEAAEVGQLVEA